MKHITLHIGPHKTGSTYIQKKLFETRDVLFREFGVFYPEQLIGPQWGHHKLVEAIKNRQDKTIKAFFESARDRTLLSSENFVRLSKQEIKYFSDILINEKVSIVFVKRGYVDILISSWQEEIKHGGCSSWSTFLLCHLARPFQSDILNLAQILGAWVESFPKAELHIISYEQVLDSLDDLVEHIFYDVFDLDVANLIQAEKINTSMDYSNVEIIRGLNILAKKDGLLHAHNVREAYLNSKDQYADELAELSKIISNYPFVLDLKDAWSIQYMEKLFQERFGGSTLKLAGKTWIMPSDEASYDQKYGQLLRIIYEKVSKRIRDN